MTEPKSGAMQDSYWPLLPSFLRKTRAFNSALRDTAMNVGAKSITWVWEIGEPMRPGVIWRTWEYPSIG